MLDLSKPGNEALIHSFLAGSLLPVSAFQHRKPLYITGGNSLLQVGPAVDPLKNRDRTDTMEAARFVVRTRYHRSVKAVPFLINVRIVVRHMELIHTYYDGNMAGIVGLNQVQHV
ncbi:hypothetical protein D3C73_1480900 [compost metagenome]